MSTARRHVKMGDLQVLSDGTLFTIGLGSCVAVALYDPESRVGGLAHVMLPEGAVNGDGRVGRFAPTAVPQLLDMMSEAGARKSAIFARIVGGAAMFADLVPQSRSRLGERNVNAVRSALEDADIPLRGEDVGGTFGRSVFFDTTDGKLTIRVVQRADVEL